MDEIRLTKLIGMMYIDVLTGDVHIRNQYMNVLITHVSVYLLKKIDARRSNIAKFRTLLHNTITMVLSNIHDFPQVVPEKPIDIAKAQSYFDKFVIKIDEKVADNIGLEEIALVNAIETLEYCRSICYSASSDYSMSLAESPDGLTSAANKFAYIISLITPIIYRYNIVDISESDYAKSALAATARLNKPKEK